MRERGWSLIILNDEDMIKTGLKLGHSLNIHIQQIDARYSKVNWEGFPGGTVVKNLPANAGDTGSSPGPGRSHMPRSN